MNKFIYIMLIAGSVAVTSCATDDLNPSLEQNKEGADAIATSSDLEGILKGAYNRMTASVYYGRDYIVTPEVRTPNTWANGRSGRFTTEALLAYNTNGLYIWGSAYGVIASANIIINSDVETLTDASDNAEYARHLQGQAYAIRALAHFDLLKTYGQEHVEGNLGIPYITEFKGDDLIPARGTIEENKAMIYSDLDKAFELMDDDFFNSSKEFMSKYTAKALESRVGTWFGEQEDWIKVRDASMAVIESGLYSIVSADQYVASFEGKGAPNSIFELAYSDTDNEGNTGLSFIYRGTSYGDISVTPNAFNLLYDEGDVRADILGTEQVASNLRLRNMGKYPEMSSNVPIIRYEEVILNLAEALMNLGEMGEALTYLNKIPEQRNAETYSAATIENILLERRKEFIFEGLYYWDLQRLEMDILKIDTEQNIAETILYGDFRRVHPIPIAELDANSNLVQNTGY